MPDLHLIGVHEDGRHLLLSGRGGEEFLLPIDDALRAVLRREYSDARPSAEPMRPIEVQAMIRAGANAQEAAERAGWPVEKVHRYEGPILAERAHIARIAGDAHVPSHTGTTVSLSERVDQRLDQRGVPTQETEWDSWRSEDGQWTVELRFAAGGRRRVASWHFSRSSMTVAPVDDEARWLSGDEAPAAPRPAGSDTAHPGGAPASHADQRSSRDTSRDTSRNTSRDSEQGTDRSVQGGDHGDDHGGHSVGGAGRDDEREGPRPERYEGAGYGTYPADADDSRSTQFGGNSVAAQDHPAPRHAHDPDSELTAGLRERAAKRGRRRPRRLPRATGPALPVEPSAGPAPSADVPPAPADQVPSTASPTSIPDVGLEPDPDAVPLQPFDYDPGRDGLPPGAHSDPRPDAQDGRPEAAAAEAAGLAVTGDGPDGGAADDLSDGSAVETAAEGTMSVPTATDSAAETEAPSDATESDTAESDTLDAADTDDTDDTDAGAEQVVSIAEESRDEGHARVGVITDSPEDDDDFTGTVTVEPPDRADADADADRSTPPQPPASSATSAPAATSADEEVVRVEPDTPVRDHDPHATQSPPPVAVPRHTEPELPLGEDDQPGPGAAAEARPAQPDPAQGAADSSRTAAAPTDAAASQEDRGPNRSGRATRRRRAAANRQSARQNTRETASQKTDDTAEGGDQPAGSAEQAERPAAKSTPPAPKPTPKQPQKQPQRQRKGRASVPAWDDIMFGAKHPTD